MRSVNAVLDDSLSQSSTITLDFPGYWISLDLCLDPTTLSGDTHSLLLTQPITTIDLVKSGR